MKFWNCVSFVSAFLVLLIASCNKSTTLPENPYTGLAPKIVVSADQLPDSNTIEGLHRYIFYPKCATNGCHDGHFEPDFRTIQSSWFTLLNATPIKKQSPYKYRVTPFDTGQSWLWHRVTTTDQVLGRMPLYDNALSPSELTAIRTWILKGAPDMFGNVMKSINYNPQIYSFAVLNSTDSTRYDTARYLNKDFGPVRVPANTNIDIWLLVADDSTLFYQVPYSKLYISNNVDDFSNAVKLDAPPQLNYLFIPKFYNNSFDAYFLFKTSLNTGNYKKGDVLFIRYESNDGKHAENSLMPNFNSPIYSKSYYSIIIE